MGPEQFVTGAADGLPAAVVIQPRGRAVLCFWAAVPGLLAAPFLFWQGVGWGVLFCALWAAVVFCVWARACSFVAAVTPQVLQVQSGIAFYVCRTLPRAGITSVLRIDTPLLRLAGASVLAVFSPGLCALLPAIPREQAQALCAALLPKTGLEDRR